MTEKNQDSQTYIVEALESCPTFAKPEMLAQMTAAIREGVWVPSGVVLDHIVKTGAETPHTLRGTADFLKAYGEAVSVERALEYLSALKRPVAQSAGIDFNDKAGLASFVVDVMKDLKAPQAIKAAAALKNSR